MNFSFEKSTGAGLVLGLALAAVGASARAQDSSVDPNFNGNVAPQGYGQDGAQQGYDPNAQYSGPQQGYPQQGYNYPLPGQGDQGAVTANAAPPAIPQYEQPVAPGDGYLWTPGYWAWDPSAGDYYWVAGQWVLPPYTGALWTPGYWGPYGGGYFWHAGFWGPYVGYYGGINYGFGYFGVGYWGGFWRGGAFYYNRGLNRFGSGFYGGRFYNSSFYGDGCSG